MKLSKLLITSHNESIAIDQPLGGDIFIIIRVESVSFGPLEPTEDCAT